MNMSDILMPKNQAVVDRLRRRVETYRQHHDECIPRFDHTTNGLNDQQKQETLLLRQRYLEAKAKKSAKKSDKSKNHGNSVSSSGGSNNGQQQQQDGTSMGVANRLQKRPCEDAEMGSSMGVGGGGGENYEPPPKMASMSGGNGTAINGTRPSNPAGTSFNKVKQKLKTPNSGGSGTGAEIVELGSGNPNAKAPKPGRKANNGSGTGASTSTASSSTANNSTNHVNHVSNNNSLPSSGPGANNGTSANSYASSNSLNIEMKQDSGLANVNSSSSISAFDDLDECAAAIEKDAANSNGSSMMASLMGLNGEPEGMIPSDTLKDLISEISDLNPDFMGDFDFDDDHSMEMSTGISLLANSLNTSSHNGDSGGMNNTVTNSNPVMSNSYGLEMGMYGNNNMNQCHSGQQQQQGHHNPVAPVTPTASSTNSSPRLGHAKHETEMSTGNSFSTSSGSSSTASHSNNPNTAPSLDNAIGNRGLSHCAGPSPAAASTASPLASQLNSHHPSQTPPYCSTGSAHFDSMSPTAGGGVAQQSHSGSSTPTSNYGPPTRVPTPSSGSKASNPASSGGGAAARIPYTSPSVHDSPAAQTLKQMAEQHQHKAQMGINSYSKSTPPNSNPSPARSPFNGDSYGSGFNNPNSTGSMGGGGEYINPSSSPVFPNVRTPSGTEAIQAMMRSNEGVTVTIKQDPNPYYNAIQQQQQQSMVPHGQQQPQGSFSQMDGPGMNPAAISKRNALAHQQQQQMLGQQPQHHKGPGMNGPGMMPGAGSGGSSGPMNPMSNPNGRIPTPTNVNPMLMQQHSPLHNNKSFNSSAANSHLHAHLSSPPVNHHANSVPPPHLQHMMNAGPGAGRSGGGPATAGTIHHHQQQQQANYQQHQSSLQHQQQQQLMYSSSTPNGPQQPNHGTSVQMSQSQQQMSISQQQSAGNSSLQVSTSGSQVQIGGAGDVNVMKSMQQQPNMYYRQSPPQQSLHSATQNPANSIGQPAHMDPFAMTGANASSGGGPNGMNNQGQTINFTQQHLRMSSSVSPGVNNPSMSPVNSNPMMSTRPNSGAGAGVMGMGPSSGGHGSGAQPLNPMGARMPMPNRMSAGQGGMSEVGMNPRAPSMEMQQRMMMRHMQMRGGSGPPNMPPQQMQMIRGPGPQQMMEYNAELMAASSASGPGGQVGMMNHSPTQSMMMSRFNGPPGAGAGAGVRPNMMPNANSNPQVLSGAAGHRLSQQQQGAMYQQHQMQQQHGMVQGSTAGGVPRGSMVTQANAMNMPPTVRGRMSSMHPNAASSGVPTPTGSGPSINPAMVRGDNGSMGFMGPQQQMQGNMNSVNNIPAGMSPQEWMALQQQQHEQGMNRNFGMQQQQAMRGNSHPTNPAYRPGAGMQMSQQQQHMMAQMGMAGNNGANATLNGGPNACFNQPQHPHSSNPSMPNNGSSSNINCNNGSNQSHFFAQQQQQQMNNMKMSQAQARMMTASSNYPHPPSSSMTNNNLHMNKPGNNSMMSIAGNGNGGTLIQPNASNGPIMHPSHHMQPSQQQQQHMMNHHNQPQHSQPTHQQQQQGVMPSQPTPQNPQQLKTDSDFNMDLFGNDPSDTDFLNSYDATASYENILDSLS